MRLSTERSGAADGERTQWVLRRLLAVAGAVVLLVMPLFMGRFATFMFTRIFILSVFALSVDIIWGYVGILSFGQAFFFGLGAYAFTLTVMRGSWDPTLLTYAGLLLALALPATAGWLFSYLLSRSGVTGPYFSVLTLALALIGEQTAISWYSFTGGYNGISGIPPLELGLPGVALRIYPGPAYYYLGLGLLLAAYRFCKRLVDSPFGHVLAAVRDNEPKAEALGFNPASYKALVYAVAGAMAGISGALYAPLSTFISPPLLGFVFSTQVLIWVLVGGRGTLVGPLVGTLAMVYTEHYFSSLFPGRFWLLMGPLLVLIILLMPEGLVGFWLRRQVRGAVTATAAAVSEAMHSAGDGT